MIKKHEVNIKKSNCITIQLWIIAILSFSYFMYEVSIYSEPLKHESDNTYTADNNTYDPDIMYDGVEVWKKPSTEFKPKTIKTSLKLPTETIKNDVLEIETITEDHTETTKTESPKNDAKPTKAPVANTKSSTNNNLKKATIHSAKTVDFLPVFPGCDNQSTNAERAACFEKKIKRLVRKKFNNRIGNELGLKGVQRIMLYFEIDQNGIVSNIKARSTGNIFDLEKEAIRVAKKIPPMEPARAGNKKVKMAYSMPIVFNTL